MSFGALELSEVGPVCYDSSSPFICIWIFVSAHSKRRVSVFVRRLLVARRMLNEQIRGREETSFVVPLFGNESSTNSHEKVSFLLFCPLLSLSYVFFSPFSLVHLFLQKRKRVDELQKSISHTYNSKFHQNIHLSIFTLTYVYSYLS